jgi:hypothetical protein
MKKKLPELSPFNKLILAFISSPSNLPSKEVDFWA